MNRPAKALCLCFGLLGLIACTPDQGGPTVSAPPRGGDVSVDAQGRVVRPRAERNWDDSVGKKVQSLLIQSDREAFKGVSVRAWDGGVLLTGAVAKPDQRRRAAETARSVEGVSQVFDDLVLTENPGHPNYVPDANLEQRIYAGLLGDDGISGAYVIRMVNGVAFLQGTTRSRADAEKAADFVRGFDGVKWVVDRVSVR
ncbi:putative periplasmic or secreted lipoprotein [Paramagnetospirillum magnetotacticum MS-1]|uniref:Putative periplasmic or secreted lipoprotein n=1 Tax=Paramagnetospirillum magnetotacticum MS-1 TaxID=272627 RepID=A0A0C2YCU6_PARME|nr:BON domain-containing protein [Paramagnetospirillum magnetotacticum]KIL97534.1 putative periplasmic or secreted lipoprotein [Paramagnetospirillum magnetotacticum MS-1]